MSAARFFVARPALLGAAAASVGWEVGKYGFTEYLSYSTGYTKLYGAIAILQGRAVGGTTNDPPSRLSIYDATDCENPRHMAEYVWPEGLHTVHISPDGMRIYGTRIEPMTALRYE